MKIKRFITACCAVMLVVIDALLSSQQLFAETIEGLISEELIDPVTKCAIGRFKNCEIDQAIARGLFETGLFASFPENMNCRTIDEGWAISYAHKRDRENYHGGIDMPAPWGTPILAAAAGTVVGKFHGNESFRGIEIVLRHSPEDTGIPIWIYTQYTHFSEIPKLEVGQRVRMGELLGPTGNSGIGRNGKQSRKRRPAVHFGVFFSTSDQFAVIRDRVIPAEGFWADPISLFRQKLPLDASSMKALSTSEKQVRISVQLDNGTVIPADSKIIWPYTCTPD